MKIDIQTSHAIYKRVVPAARKFSRKVVIISFLAPIYTSTVFGQEETAAGRVPDYPISYDLPSVENVKGVLKRVRTYYEASSPQTIVNSKTGERITNFGTFNPLARPSNGFSSEWSYTHGVVLSAFDYISKVTGDQSYVALNTKFYDYVVTHLPYFQKNTSWEAGEKIGNWGRILHFEALDDCGSIGAAMIKTYLNNKNEKYLPMINRVDEHVSRNQYRLADGTLARNRPQYTSVWADDMYMSVPFLANMGVLTGKKKYFDDAVKQVLQMGERLYVPEKELFDHGWNATSAAYDPRFYWGRANGWTLMAMAELLSVLPEKHKGRDKILHLYRSMVRSLANLQDGAGFWHNLLDKPDTYQETSCTAMFTYAIAKGINEGWISHVYGPVALTGWNAISTKVRPNGAVDDTVEGTTFAHDNTYYYHRGKSIYATHGYGPVLYAGAEMIRLLQNEKLEILKAKPNAINSTYHFLLKSEWPKK
ncbi:glycoside hydrolase family 105 protein [Pedobacter sp. SYSU D00535]|uniref:glycoside hydrolase family 88/105 protein n=1 Tax=Pedobacter sp. SYSU D00535 TaxID=2810308 RepID=UPI001A95E84B|nr:glycoside hydrolase family 88 protein [Pedobacter sp. SYSU D00535]